MVAVVLRKGETTLESFRKLSATVQDYEVILHSRKNLESFFVVSRSAIKALLCLDGQAANTVHRN